MATLSALMTMTKSPPSTLGVNVGLCLPRSRFAAATASRPSTTSVASMTYHERVVSPAFGVYVGTALTFSSRVSDPGFPGAGQAFTAGWFSASDIDPRTRAYRTPTRQLTCGRRRRSKRVTGHYVEDDIRVGLVGHIRGHLNASGAACVLVHPGASDDGHRNGVTADEQRGGVSHALDDDLAARE